MPSSAKKRHWLPPMRCQHWISVNSLLVLCQHFFLILRSPLLRCFDFCTKLVSLTSCCEIRPRICPTNFNVHGIAVWGSTNRAWRDTISARLKRSPLTDTRQNDCKQLHTKKCLLWRSNSCWFDIHSFGRTQQKWCAMLTQPRFFETTVRENTRLPAIVDADTSVLVYTAINAQ